MKTKISIALINIIVVIASLCGILFNECANP